MELVTLTDQQLAELGPEGLWDHVADVQRFRNRLDADEARVLGCAERMGAAAGAGERRSSDVVRRRAGVGRSEAKWRTKTARTVVEHPEVGDALGRGGVDAEQVLAIGGAGVPEPVRVELLGDAETQTADETVAAVRAAEGDHADPGERFVRQRQLRTAPRFGDRDGMGNLHCRFDPQTAAATNAVIDAHLQRLWQRDKAAGCTGARSADQRLADAIADLIVGTTAPTDPGDRDHTGQEQDETAADTAGSGPPRATINVVVPHTWLLGGCRAHGLCADGTELSAATLRRLACDADLLPTVLGGPSEVLDLGRARRTATPQQRRALQARDRGCVVPGCNAPPARCQAHHLHTWHHGGHTDLELMALVCHDHHIWLHEGRYRLERNPDGTWTLIPP